MATRTAVKDLAPCIRCNYLTRSRCTVHDAPVCLPCALKICYLRAAKPGHRPVGSTGL